MDNVIDRKKGSMELTYGRLVTGVFKAVNPLKKIAMDTPCVVHRYINNNAINILENEGYVKEAYFYRTFINSLNDGVTYADQDFKSINHFYDVDKKRGLYGFSNALIEAEKYKLKAIYNIKIGNIQKSVYCLGVAAHLIQDMTVPQHASNRLLNSHKSYETWIKKNIFKDSSYIKKDGILKLNSLKEYIENNGKYSNEVLEYLKNEKNKEDLYKEMSKVLLDRAHTSTAGFLLWFYTNYYESA